MYNEGDRVLIIDGDNKGQFAKYLYHEGDSGYWVPHVKLEGTEIIVRPWDREIVSMADLESTKKRLEDEVQKNNIQLEDWKRLDKD